MSDLENKDGANPEAENAEGGVSENSVLGSLFKAWSEATADDTEKTEEKTETAAEEKPAAVAEEKPVEKPVQPVVFSDDEEEKKPLNVKLIGGIAAGVIVLIILMVLILTHKPTIDLADYTTVTFESANGYGKAKVTIDYDKIQADYGEKVKIDNKSENLILRAMSLKSILMSTVSVKVDPNANLSNDSKVKVVYTFNKDAFSQVCNANVKAEEKEYKVEGLREVLNFDPFEDMDIFYEGYSGNGSITVSAKAGSKVLELVYSVNKDYELKNGDTVVASVRTYNGDINSYCLENGYKPTAIKKEITLDGFKEYEKVDVFADLKITYDGVDGNAKIELNADDVKYDNIDFFVSKTEKISNGDKITIKVNDTANRYLHNQGYEAEALEKEIEVSGLEKGAEYDPFDEIELIYTGVSPDASVSINTDNVTVEGLNFELSKNNKIANGDELTITVKGSWGTSAEDACLNAGYTLKSTEKTIEVEGISYYLDDLSQLTDDAKKFLEEECDDITTSKVSGWNNPDSLKSIKLIDMYLQTPKSNSVDLPWESGWGTLHNALYMMYEVKIDNDENDSKFTYYWPIKFGNIVVLEDGEIDVDTTIYNYQLDEFKKDNLWYNGYEKLATFTTKQINAKRDVFKSTNSAAEDEEE